MSLEFDPDSQHEVLVSLNPSAGARNGKPLVEDLVARLAEKQLQARVIHDIDQLVAESTEAHEARRLRAVVAAGGDGTVSLVVNRLPQGVPVAVFPLGTENLLSKYLGIEQDPEQVCRAILAGKHVVLDAGEANGRIFLLMVGCGFDAEVVRRLHRERSGNIHHLSYAKPILDSIRSYQYPTIRIRLDALPEFGRTDPQALVAKWAFVVNIPRYAGGLQISPDAAGDDGLLDICTFRQGSLWNGLRYLGGILLRRHQGWSDFRVERCRTVRLESDGDVPYQLDGDPGGRLPVDIRILPGRLTMIVPEGQSQQSPSSESVHLQR